MKVRRLIENRKPLGNFRAGLLLLCGIFLFGFMIGHFACNAVADDDIRQLRDYLMRYGEIMQQPQETTASFLSLLIAYCRYPLLVFLLGFSAAGIVLIPVVCMSKAFFLSFSIRCFARAFGQNGVLLALSALGIRCLFTVPCTLFLALWAVKDSIRRINNQRPFSKQENGGAVNSFLRLLGCLLLLLSGVILELLLVPDLICNVLTNLT